MRKAVLVLVVLVTVVLIVFYYPTYIEKPEKDGRGPLAIRIDARFAAPEYHSPLDYWMTNHKHFVNRGDIEERDCVYCHVPQESCNNCHNYVGVDEIVIEEISK